MVPRGEINELWRCCGEITALARTASCPTSMSINWDCSRESSSLAGASSLARIPQESRVESERYHLDRHLTTFHKSRKICTWWCIRRKPTFKHFSEFQFN